MSSYNVPANYIHTYVHTYMHYNRVAASKALAAALAAHPEVSKLVLCKEMLACLYTYCTVLNMCYSLYSQKNLCCSTLQYQ
jgi:hypothetical protein